MAVAEHRMLLEQGKRIRLHLVNLSSSLAEASPRISSNAITSLVHASDRFSLWASNIGLFSPSHASLDYRLRGNEQVRIFANELLLTLTGLFQKVEDISVGIRKPFEVLNTNACLSGDGVAQEDGHGNNSEDQVRSRGSSVGSSSLGSDIDVVFGGVDEENHETEAELLIEQISSVIDQLFSLALQIRNPTNRKTPAVERIDLYQHVIPNFKDQYIKTRKDMEYQGLMQIFQQCRREAKRADDNENGTDSDLDELDKALIRRFLRANHIRRCYFHYWKRHKIKSSRFASAMNEPKDDRLPAPSMPRTAITRQLGALSVRPSEVSHQLSSNLTSAIPLPADFVLNENIAPSSQSSRAPMVIETGPDGLAVHWPMPPGGYYSSGKTKDFECPYCFFFCSSRTAKAEAWKQHLRFDLQPYQCTYEECSDADILYHNFDAWNLHEQRMHRRIWVCHLDKADFTEKSAYENHVRAAHPDRASLLLTPELISFRESTTKECDRPCPVCLKGFGRTLDLQKHLARHLESIALLSLPPEDQGDESGSHAGSLDQSDKAERRHPMISMSIANDFPEAGGEPPTFDGNAHLEEAVLLNHTGPKLTSESLMNILEERESGIDPQAIQANHVGMYKFEDEDREGYRNISQRLSQWLSDVQHELGKGKARVLAERSGYS